MITPSPYKSAAPNSPSVTSTLICTESVLRCRRCWMSASSAKIPPSPRLSARRMNEMYFTLTISVSAHTINESTP